MCKTTECEYIPNVKATNNGTCYFILPLKQQCFQRDALIMNKYVYLAQDDYIRVTLRSSSYFIRVISTGNSSSVLTRLVVYECLMDKVLSGTFMLFFALLSICVFQNLY